MDTPVPAPAAASGVGRTVPEWANVVRTRWREAALVLATLALGAVARTPSLATPLDESHHAFRQTQTAYTAFLFHRDGIDLLHARLPVLGPPFEVPFELPVFQALASLVMDVGVPPDPAVRLTSLAWFLLTGLLIWALVRRFASSVAALAALVLFVASPFSLVWSRAQLMEYMATAGAIGWVLAGIAWRDRRRPLLWILATLGGSVALLVKITSGIFWVLPLLAYHPPGERSLLGDALDTITAATRSLRERSGEALRRQARAMGSLVGLGSMIAIPGLLALGWTAHADAIKAGTIADWMTSGNLWWWNVGSLEQRTDPDTWQRIAGYATAEFGIVLVALFVLGLMNLLRPRRPWLFWLAVAGTALLPLLAFTNLYWIHDYYLIAVTPGVAIVQGLLVGDVHRWLRLPVLRAMGAGLVALVLIWSVLTTRDFWGSVYGPPSDPDGTLAQAAELARLTEADDLVLAEGRDWSPAVLYHARRGGLALPGWMVAGRRTDLIDPEVYEIASVAEPARGHLELLERWAAVGVIGAHTYRLGASAGEVGEVQSLALDAGATTAPAGSAVLEVPTRPIACDGADHPLPTGRQGTWLFLEGPLPAAARVWTGAADAPVPLRDVIVLPARPDGAQQTLACSGMPELRIGRALDAPPPWMP